MGGGGGGGKRNLIICPKFCGERGATLRRWTEICSNHSLLKFFALFVNLGSKCTPKYLKNDKCYKPETLGGVRGILQGLKILM